MLGNTYHLHFRPGEELIAELGGLHEFMGWDGAILTDSGGFQVFSLRDTLLATDDDGVTFRSVYDGQAERFTPELAARVQELLGSDIAMCLDICLARGRVACRARGGGAPDDAWAERQRDLPRAPGQLRFAITQGGLDRELRSTLVGGARRARLRRLRDRRPQRGGAPRADVRGDERTPQRCCPRRSPATSWESATRRACSR